MPRPLALAFQVAIFQGLFAYAQISLPLANVPLAVKTPYLNTWTPSSSGWSFNNQWPTLYSTSHVLGWVGYIRVDKKSYAWLGADSSGATLLTPTLNGITPTKSVVRFAAGNIQFNVTFLTPIEPNDYVKQSMPFSYVYIDAFSANDSQPHEVQIYSDISAEWVTNDITNQVVWNTTENNDIVYHNMTRKTPQPVVDDSDMAEDGIGVYAMLQQPGLTWQTCAIDVCRPWFVNTGSLNNTRDTNFRPVNGTANDSWPVYAFSVNLGTISPGKQPDPVVFAVGLVRDPVVVYTAESPSQNRSSYYMTKYATPRAAITAFLQDFSNAQTRNSQFDDTVMTSATQISSQYAGILALVTRQIFASMDITVQSDSHGSFNPSDVKIFMKDMGRSRRANPVDVIYGALPALLFFNSSIAAGLIEPLLASQSTLGYQNPYGAPDLGNQYPLITGAFISDTDFALESSSTIIIMTYAHAVKSGDGFLLNRYRSTLQKYADYLVNQRLNLPAGSLTYDNTTTIVDPSNESLKSILAIYCMGRINEALGVNGRNYTDQATQFLDGWKQLAITGNQINPVYGMAGSSGLIYNLFPAVWLNMSLNLDDVISNQTQFYAQENGGLYGFPLDSTQPGDLTYPHWTMWMAATVPSNSVSTRNKLVDFVYNRVTAPSVGYPLPVEYSASTGDSDDNFGIAGSALHGAAYSILALGLQNVPINSNASQWSPRDPGNFSSHKTHADFGAIVGGVIGGIGGALILVFVGLFFWRRTRKRQQTTVNLIEDPTPFNLSPYGYSAVNSDSTTELTNNTSSGGNQWSQGQGTTAQQEQTSSSVLAGPLAAATPKQKEALGVRQHAGPPSESAVSTLTNPHSAPASTSGAEDLRAEVEQLRREMINMRQIADPPPEYT